MEGTPNLPFKKRACFTLVQPIRIPAQVTLMAPIPEKSIAPLQVAELPSRESGGPTLRKKDTQSPATSKPSGGPSTRVRWATLTPQEWHAHRRAINQRAAIKHRLKRRDEYAKLEQELLALENRQKVLVAERSGLVAATRKLTHLLHASFPNPNQRGPAQPTHDLLELSPPQPATATPAELDRYRAEIKDSLTLPF